jgi:ADP-heptose:LPS heptosyltransferase
MRGKRTIVMRILWGLGDVLCTTPAVRAYRAAYPQDRIVFRTYVKGVRRLEYDGGREPGEGGSPDEMLWDNPNIDAIIDADNCQRQGKNAHEIELRYAYYGCPPLDEPLQARYFDCLNLPRPADGRYDADYFMRPHERAAAAETLKHHDMWAHKFCALTPRVGWAGKMWRDDGWQEIMRRLHERGWTPVILAGRPLQQHDWSECGAINLSGMLDMRQTAAVLDRCQAMLATEGGLSNLRFALRKPAVVLTCATSYERQVWAPPELCTEVRNPDHCVPCMWRGLHAMGQAHVPPGDVGMCPEGKTLRDLNADFVWPFLEKDLMEADSKYGATVAVR